MLESSNVHTRMTSRAREGRRRPRARVRPSPRPRCQGVRTREEAGSVVCWWGSGLNWSFNHSYWIRSQSIARNQRDALPQTSGEFRHRRRDRWNALPGQRLLACL